MLEQQILFLRFLVLKFLICLHILYKHTRTSSSLCIVIRFMSAINVVKVENAIIYIYMYIDDAATGLKLVLIDFKNTNKPYTGETRIL